jgi:hypothetical protein
VKPVSIMLADLGYKKGESPVTEENIEKIAVAVKESSWAPQKEKADANVTRGGCCS